MILYINVYDKHMLLFKVNIGLAIQGTGQLFNILLIHNNNILPWITI